MLRRVKRQEVIQSDIDQLSESISRLLRESSLTSKLSTLKKASKNSKRDGQSKSGEPTSLKTHRILILDDYADEETEPVLSDVRSVLKEYSSVMTAIIMEAGASELDDRVLEEVVEILAHVITAMENEALEQSK
jgi:hypothetical protein